jgi:hypothetical protein
MDSGEKVYTGAYMIRAGTGADAKLPKERYLSQRVFTPLWDLRASAPVNARSCEAWDRFFSGVFGMGEFMRNQIITDLKYSHYLDEGCADWSTFCLAGPGTTRGLNRIYGHPLNHSFKHAEANALLQNIRVALLLDPIVRLTLSHTFLDLNNVANCLCEFDKYMRLRNGEGEPRSHYKPSTEPLPYDAE